MSLLATLFVHPMVLSSQTLWLAIPVSLAVAAVYKTLRTQSLKRLPLEIGLLSLYILAGMAALMVGFWAILNYWPKGSPAV